MIRKVMAVAAIVAAFGLVTPAGAATVANGGFEAGTTGWTVSTVVTGPWPAGWVSHPGSTSPISGFWGIFPPMAGSFTAVADQNGPASIVLYQDIVLDPDAGHAVKLSYYWMNRYSGFLTPPTLEITGPGASNQQFRIDLVKTTAPLRSVAAGDVLANLVQTPVGSPLIKAPTTLTSDLSALAGQTIRLRAAVADTLYWFQAGLDAVSVATLKTNPALLNLIPGTDVYTTLSATLSGSAPVAGRTITFKSGATPLCTGVTNPSGVASCGALTEQLQTLTTGVTAEFAGATDLPAVAHTAPFAIVAGNSIP